MITLQDRISELIAQHGSLRAVSRVLGIDPGYLSRLHSGEKVNPEKEKLHRLGLRRVVTYEPLGDCASKEPTGCWNVRCQLGNACHKI